MSTANRGDLIKELQQLTNIPVLTMQKLENISEGIISHLVAECKEQGNNCVIIDIGLGDLKITFMEDTIFYKFSPHKSLQDAVLDSSLYGASKLEIDAEKALAKKIKDMYRELL